MMKRLITFSILGLLAACSSRPVTPDTEDVKVSREAPPAKCKEADKVTGQTRKINQGAKDALEDLKRDAAAKGINYVQIQQYSESGASVTGLGYICP